MTKRPYQKIPFYFQLVEANPREHISKRAILSKEIEFEENRDRTEKMTGIQKELVDKKAMERDYTEALQAREIQRLEAEHERRTRDIETKKEKYFDPEAFELPYYYYGHGGQRGPGKLGAPQSPERK